MPENRWILLNMPENAWKNCSDYATVLNMPWYSYNNIIIVTKVTMLAFLSAQFVHPGALLPFYRYWTQCNDVRAFELYFYGKATNIKNDF